VIDERLETICQAYQRLGLKLASVANLESVEVFEKMYNFSLPEEYRRFVLEVGNGGDGPPHYGMFPVEKSDHGELGNVFDGYAPHLDFSLTDAWIWEGEDYDEAKVNEVHVRGHIYLGTDGCGMQHVLISSGVERGNVWMLTGEGVQPVFVEDIFEEDKRYTFLDWLETWVKKR
jgi:hypothetical protein